MCALVRPASPAPSFAPCVTMRHMEQHSPDQHAQRVGIRELRHQFRAYVDRVQRGERFVITDRGTPVGELVPHVPKRSLIDRMIDEGRALPATRRIGLGFVPTGTTTTTGSEALQAMRDEDRQL